MKKLFTFFLTLFVANSVWAEDVFEVDGIFYNYVNDGVKVTYPKDNGVGIHGVYSGDVTIPSSVTYNGNSYSVTSIGSSAFYDCSGLTSITIPNSVTSIGSSAFSCCSGLTSVTIPNSVTSIGSSAFFRCSGLTSITIPNSVTSIGSSAFYDCSGLTSITIPNSVTSIGEDAFHDCSGLTAITIPNSVTSIGEDAFHGCSGLTAITIPNSVTSIGEDAFYGCSGLTAITIPNSVTSIGEDAFYGCSGLTAITIPNSVTSIGEDAFYGCSGLTSITIDSYADISNADLEFTKNGTKYRILSKTSVEVAETGRWLDEEETIWFTDYSGDVVIPQSVEFTNNTYVVTGIGEVAFGCCENLTSVTIPNSVTSIKAGAFAECTNLTSIICLTDIPPVIIDRFSGCDGDYDECFENPFITGGRNAVTVYVPSEVVSLYKVALDWRSSPVDIQPIPAENVSISKDEVDVKVEKSSADFYMPMNASADSYTLTIKNNGVTFCTLTFNPQGQLANIDFSTTKSYELKADVSAFKFSVTGLSAATDYKYSFKALASNKTVLKEYSGSFTTKNEDGTGGSVQGGGEGTLGVDAVSNATAVTIVKGQVLVNGEAPAFVVTVSGQKITNANLKSGVYFVVVDGEMVKVMK